MASSAVRALRNKYAEDLEEILQCPVCFETLYGTVPTCLQGHHICIKCLPQLPCCPFCKSNFNGSRNYLAETLLTKFDEIKVSLIDPHHRLNKNNKICVQTQTDSIIFENSQNNNKGLQPVANNININTKQDANCNTAPIVGKGKYPCRLGSCFEELPHGRMLPHIRYYHTKNLVEEKLIGSNKYEKEWRLPYKVSNTFNQAIHIPNMGLFFLHIIINDDGDLHGYVQIVNTYLVSKEFQYKLGISNSYSSTSYEGTVLPCRSNTNKLNEKSLYVNNLFMSHILKRKRDFNCSLIIKRQPKKDLSLKENNSKSTLPMEL